MPSAWKIRSAVRPLAAIGALCVALGGVAPGAQAASSRRCSPVVNPYAGTRYEGIDLRQIRAVRTACSTARRVVLGAHRKALGTTPPPSGVRRFRWDGWRVTGDLRGSADHYVATRGSRRVRWVF